MTASLTAQRLLKAYTDLAAEGYPGGPAAFSELADLAEVCVIDASHEEWLPATVVLNAFHNLSIEPVEEAESSGPRTVVPPEFHQAILSTLKLLVHGGNSARCLELSKQLVRSYPKTRGGP